MAPCDASHTNNTLHDHDQVSEAADDDTLHIAAATTQDNTDDVKRELNLSPETNATSLKSSSCSVDAPTKTISYLSTALGKQEDSLFITPSLRQSLFVFVVFILGIYTGICYVGWVQHKYGFGKDPTMEKKCLPYGPNSHQQTSELLAAERKAMSTEESGNDNRKEIRLKRDNPNQRKHLLPTLFGLEYSNLVGRPADDINHGTHNEPTIHVSASWYSLAFNKRISLTPSESDMIQSIARKVHENIPDLEQRSVQVSWGGPHNAVPETTWWSRQHPSHSNELSAIDGGHSLYAYLFIMKWNPHPHFPFRLCGEHGCPPERAISHSLQWREAYKPWLAPPSLLEENVKGYAYHRGFSPSPTTPNGKHGLVWLRLNHTVKHDISFFRGILHAGDRAIAQALVESKGETGKFNVIIDCGGFSLSGTPTLHALQQGVTMLQDHYPNRLGMIFLVHLSRVGEIFLKVVLSIITKEVRDKIKILPNHDKAKSLAILRTVVEEDYIPDWLGGTDTYRFEVEEYYEQQHRCTEEEAEEFLTTMPYHAK